MKIDEEEDLMKAHIQNSLRSCQMDAQEILIGTDREIFVIKWLAANFTASFGTSNTANCV